MNIADTYEKVIELYQDRNRFAQNYYNYDKDGKKCGWADGYSFCVLGAMSHVSDGMSREAQCCLQRVSEMMYGDVIQVVNDSEGGYEKVLEALKMARVIWRGYEPTDDELGLSVFALMEKRANEQRPLIL